MSDPQEPRQPANLSEALRLLDAQDPRQRALSAKTLGRQGEDARPAVPHLVARLEDPDPMVRSVAAAALGRIGAAEAVAPLTRALTDPLVPVRFWVAEALGQIGVPDAAALAALTRLAAEPEAHVRAAALRALVALRPPGPRS